jgi:hypothetical protein
VAVRWDDETDGVLDGDLTAALTYLTPAGGAVATSVAPIGLRDREEGWVGFTTSMGFGKKLDRIERDPHVALAFHAREHGRSTSQRFVLVQGRAEIVADPDPELNAHVMAQVPEYLGDLKRGPLWDRWLKEYYAVRVPVKIHVDRITSWPDLHCEGTPEIVGSEPPHEHPAPQAPPRNGTGPRVDVAKAARTIRAKRHQLLAYRGADGFPVAVPIQLEAAGSEGLRLRAEPGMIPPGGRRAGLLAHSYRAHLIGLSTRYLTGWLESGGDGVAVYAPHTHSGFAAPPNKTLLLISNGALAKAGVRKAIRAGKPLPRGFHDPKAPGPS